MTDPWVADYSFGRPGAAALKAAGCPAVIRYIGTGDGQGKFLTKEEVDELQAAGIEVAVVVEPAGPGEWMLEGYERGKYEAQNALDTLEAFGLPSDTPLRVACDFNATKGGPTSPGSPGDLQMKKVQDTLNGFTDVAGRSRTILYGGYFVIDWFETKGAKQPAGYWQTQAWSTDGSGKLLIHPKATLFQVYPPEKLNGADIDRNRILGNWNLKKESPVSDFVAGRVWGDIDRVHPTLIARAQRAGRSGNFSISVQDGWRSMADAWKFWNAYQSYLRGGPWAPVAAYPGTSLHMGNPPAYNPALAMDLTIHLPNGSTVSPRSEPVRSHMYAAGLHDPVLSEDWHWQAKEDRYPPMEKPDPIVEVLKQGSTGNAVKVLQSHINYLMRGKPGYATIAEDGVYGPGTVEAVKQYQRQAPGLTADGIAGEQTQNSIAFFYARRENRYSDQPTVKINDVGHGPAVELVQRLCVVMGQQVVVDGKFGPGTEAAVKVVQGKWGLSQDGICGPQWWAKADDLMDIIGTPN